MRESAAKLNINGMIVPVRIDDMLLINTEHFGEFAPSDISETIAGNVAEEVMQNSFWHETFEAINHIYGGLRLTHNQIEFLASAMYQLHKDNNIDEILIGLGERS